MRTTNKSAKAIDEIEGLYILIDAPKAGPHEYHAVSEMPHQAPQGESLSCGSSCEGLIVYKLSPLPMGAHGFDPPYGGSVRCTRRRAIYKTACI